MTDHSKAAPTKSFYFVIYALIVGLILAAVGVSYAKMGSGAIYLNLLIAGAQASLLAYFFMHLKGADHLTWLIAGAGMFWLLILFLFLLTDYVTRQIAAY
jgi:cytochrome c oxidase subunit 4